VYVCVYIYIYIYIYIYTIYVRVCISNRSPRYSLYFAPFVAREVNANLPCPPLLSALMRLYIYIHIYIYTHIYI